MSGARMPRAGNRRLFHTAVLQARKGRYAEASLLLARAREAHGCTELEALDLRARIYAQQGLFLDAESCWLEARSQVGSGDPYLPALNRVRQMNRWHNGRLALPAGVVLLLVVGVAIFQMVGLTREVRHRQAADSDAVTALRADLLTLHRGSSLADQDIASRLSAIDARLLELGTEMSTRLESVATRGLTIANQQASTIRALAGMEARMAQRLDSAASAGRAAILLTESERVEIESRIEALRQRLDRLTEAVAALRKEHER